MGMLGEGVPPTNQSLFSRGLTIVIVIIIYPWSGSKILTSLESVVHVRSSAVSAECVH